MGSVERDPSGLLERVPELGRLAERHQSLKGAIEQGRPHAVYRALFWIRLTRKAGADAELIEHLLATRRLFLTPLRGAPAMLTYNGIGSRPYGNSEPDPQDGSYLITLYLVLLFVPVYPFSAYLVRPAGKGWTFFGKVPLSAVGYFWQRGMALLGLVAVLIGGQNALGAMRYNTVQLVNALPTPVQVTVGQAEPVTVLSGKVEKVRTKVGAQDVVVKLDGRVLERGTLEVKRGYDVDAWNVLGAGALYREEVVYTANGVSDPAKPEGPELLCGERTVLRDGIDFAFTTPPSEVSMGEHEDVTRRSHFGLAEVPPTFCVFKLGNSGKRAQAKALAQAVASASDYSLDTVTKLVRFLAWQDDPKGALELADLGRKKHEGVIELHRLYQDRMLADGQREALLKEYEERARLTPDSADAAYLLGRLMFGKAADQYVTASQARFPSHPYILRSAAYRALARGEYSEVERLVDALRPIDVKLWQVSLDLELRALAASSKVEKARGLVKDCLSSPNLEPDARFETVVDGLLLTHFEPQFAEDSLVQALHDDNSAKTRELRVAARVNGCASVSADELGAIEDKDLKSRLELELKARKDPKAALAEVLAKDDASPGITAAAWGLLLAEAARLDEHHPALSRLAHWAPIGDSGVAAFTRYVRQGTWNEELEDLPQDVLAAADFVRSRSAAASAERVALRDKASREDALHGPVAVAMKEWP